LRLPPRENQAERPGSTCSVDLDALRPYAGDVLAARRSTTGVNMKLKLGFRDLLAEADARIETLDVGTVAHLLDDPEVQLMDIRDIRELEREGTIAGAFHAPRGMLEFWVDPDSPYHKPIFASGKRFVLFCGSGWRSALAADVLTRMGLPRVCHMAGGFSAWKAAGLAVAPVVRKP
jgi:rhodanese-related sulfurtransferase